MEILEHILAKYGVEKKAKYIDNSINKVELIAGFKLPEDYKMFVSNYYGFEGFIGSEYICLWNFEDIIERNMEYQIFEDLTKTLAIGGNAGGEYIAIELIGDNQYRIVLSPFIIIDTEAHIEVGRSFTNFLENLDDEKEWFS
ncbi:SMI1/KNR4 family protein [Agrobacterium tumefaciens]|nr:SMI1/KNR4 family protein [Agrobacterium tumefaciens]NTE23025.1 SMI1/KNR4 family protein [Agrobacterium tumefaciens]